MRVVGGEQGSRDARWLDESQQRSWRSLVVGTTLLTHHLDDELHRSCGRSLTEYEVLVRLSEADGRQMRMAQLADSLCLSRSRITHTVARMEDAGLVERASVASDGRGVVARLTDDGMDLLVGAAPAHVADVRAHLVDLVDPDDLTAMGRVMDAVCDKLLPEHPAAEIR